MATEGDAWTARLRVLVPDLSLREDDLLVVGVGLCGKDGRVRGAHPATVFALWSQLVGSGVHSRCAHVFRTIREDPSQAP